MAEFTPINTQEELNNVIGERLRRERETVTKEYQDQITAKDTEIEKFKTDMADLNKKLEDANQKISGISALEDKIRGYERASVKSKIARETGIPYELADRLTGETEEDLRKDAEGLRKLIGRNQKGAPAANGERSSGNSKENISEDAWRIVLQDMKKGD